MIAVVGATGVLGTQLITALNELDHPLEELSVFASERSHGKEIAIGEETLDVEPVDFKGVKLALIATPLAVAKGLIDEAKKQGTRVLDFSGAYRSDLGVPLVAPGINDVTDAPVISIAGAGGLALSTLLKPLNATWVEVTALFGAAHRGNAGVARLEEQTRALLSGRPSEGEEPFAHTLAYNVFPQVGAFAKGHPRSSEELAVALDVSRVLGKTPLVHVTALHVPVFHGLVFSLHGQLQGSVEKLEGAPNVKVLDQPDEAIYPTAQLTADDDSVHVGRIRTATNHLWCVAAVDSASFVARRAARLALTIWQPR